MSHQQIAIAHHWLRAHLRWHTLHGQRLRRFQQQRAHRMIALAWHHAPAYRQHWQAAGLDLAGAQQHWQHLPLVDRGQQMCDFAAFNTAGITLAAATAVATAAEDPQQIERSAGEHSLPRGISAGFSSGTSGQRGLFLASTAERNLWAGIILARALPRFDWQGYRIALFLRAHNPLYTAATSRLVHLRYLSLAAAQRDPQQALAALELWQPHAIIAPPSLLAQFAALPHRLHPERLVSVAEVLEPPDQAHLEAAFGVPVHQIYQATEGMLAITCRHGRLHLQEDVLAFQLVPVQGADPALLYIQPILTDLWRTTQPMLRYALDDILQLDPQPCPCGAGMQVLRAVIGRAADMLYLRHADGTRRLLDASTLRELAGTAHPAVRDYQIVQEHPHRLLVRLALDPAADAAGVVADVQRQAHALAAARGWHTLQIRVLPQLEPIPPGVKRRRVICRITN